MCQKNAAIYWLHTYGHLLGCVSIILSILAPKDSMWWKYKNFFQVQRPAHFCLVIINCIVPHDHFVLSSSHAMLNQTSLWIHFAAFHILGHCHAKAVSWMNFDGITRPLVWNSWDICQFLFFWFCHCRSQLSTGFGSRFTQGCYLQLVSAPGDSPITHADPQLNKHHYQWLALTACNRTFGTRSSRYVN
jgi:hypothetical protein